MSHLATTAIGALLPHQADHERQHGIDLAGSRSRWQRTTLCARRTAGAVMCDFSPRAALRKSRCGMSFEARWPPCPTGSREPWRSRRSSHFDGHGFADLVLTPRRPAAQLAPLHRVDHLTLARSPIRDPLHRRLQPFCYLHDCFGCFRLERLPSGPCTHWKAPPYSRRTRSADVADSGRSGWGKAVNRVERYRTAAACRAVPTFGSPMPAFGRSRRRAILALASPEQRLGGRASMEPSRLVCTPLAVEFDVTGARRLFALRDSF